MSALGTPPLRFAREHDAGMDRGVTFDVKRRGRARGKWRTRNFRDALTQIFGKIPVLSSVGSRAHLKGFYREPRFADEVAPFGADAGLVEAAAAAPERPAAQDAVLSAA